MTHLIRGQALKLSCPPSLAIRDKLITVGIPTEVHLVNVQDETQTGSDLQGVISAMDRVFRIPDGTREEIHRRVCAKLQIKGELFPCESDVAGIDFWWDIQKDIEDTVAEVLRDSLPFRQNLGMPSRPDSQQQKPSSTKSYEQELFSWLSDWTWTARIQDDDVPERMISISTTDDRLAERIPQYDLQLVTRSDPGPQATRSTRIRFTVPQLMVLTDPRTGETRPGKMSDALLEQISRSTAILLKRAEDASMRSALFAQMTYAQWFATTRMGLLVGLTERTEDLIRRSAAAEVLPLSAASVLDMNQPERGIGSQLASIAGRYGPIIEIITSARPVLSVSSAAN